MSEPGSHQPQVSQLSPCSQQNEGEGKKKIKQRIIIQMWSLQRSVGKYLTQKDEYGLGVKRRPFKLGVKYAGLKQRVKVRTLLGSINQDLLNRIKMPGLSASVPNIDRLVPGHSQRASFLRAMQLYQAECAWRSRITRSDTQQGLRY